MIKNSVLILILLITTSIYSQNFEGKVIYQNTYESKTQNVSNEQLNLLMGTLQEQILIGHTFNGKRPFLIALPTPKPRHKYQILT